MPAAAPRPCTYPGCGRLVRDGSGRCEAHAHKDNRPNSSKRGYGAAWQKARAVFLRINPLCVHCHQSGRLTAASVVDHIEPHRGDPELF